MILKIPILSLANCQLLTANCQLLSIVASPLFISPLTKGGDKEENMEYKIFVKKPYLIFREDAKKLGYKIKRKKCKKISIDFSKVVFMSRSFIDELLNQTKKTNKYIKFQGLNPSLKKFISKVEQTKIEIQKILSNSKS